MRASLYRKLLDPNTQSHAQILIVEDEKIIAKDLELRLKSLKYGVVGSVTNSEDCLALLEQVQPDLILMDIMIDGPLDGIETAHQVRARYDIPIIFLTAYADESTFQRAKLSGPFAYIIKPFQVNDLDRWIQTVLERHQLERQVRDNEARYRLLFESTQEAILVLDDEANLMEANKATEALFGRTRADLLTCTLPDLSGLDAPARFMDGWRSLLAQGHGEGRYRLTRQDGQTRYVEYTLRIGFMPQRHLAVLRDVTKAVQDQRDKDALARIPAEAPSPILRVSSQGALMYANRQADLLRQAWGGPDSGLALPAEVRSLLAELSATEPHGSTVVQAGSRYYQLLATFVPREGYINIYFTDVTDQHFSEALVSFQRDVLEQVAKGQNLTKTLFRLVDGVENLLPEVQAMLLYTAAGEELPRCIPGSHVSEGEVLALGVALADQPANQIWSLAAGSPLQQLQQTLQEKLQTHLQGTVLTLPGQEGLAAPAGLVVFWPAERPLTNRENSVCKLAVRLSSTAFERDATFKRLSQQSLAFENINDAIILTDPLGLITDWSPSAERIFQLRKQEVVGRKLEELTLLAPELGTPLKGANAQPDRYTAHFTRPDASTGWVELSQVEMTDANGTLLGRLRVARDITQKKMVEQKLNLSEQHLKAIFDNSIQSFVLLDLAYKVVAFNGQAERWVAQFKRRNLRKDASITQFWPTTKTLELKRALRAAAGGEVEVFEDFLLNDEDLNVWLEVSCMPVRDANGNVGGICLTALDIGERKINEETLARSEARYRSLVQNSSDLVLLLNQEGAIEYASETSLRLTGYGADQLVGQKLNHFVHERDRLKLIDALRSAIDREERTVQLEYRFLRNDAPVLTFESVITNELDNPSIRALVVNTRDITERKMAEESLRNIVRGVSAYAGEDYFDNLAENLALHLGIPNVVLAEVEGSTTLRSLAMVINGSPSRMQDLGQVGIFCAELLQAGYVYEPNVAASAYAADPLLARFKARFVIGVALRGAEGRSLGVLLAAGAEVPDSLSLAENMLKIFSVRAAVELERIYSTRALEASKANLLALVENTDDAIWSLDPQFRITALNNSFRSRFSHMFTDGIEAGDSVLELMGPEAALPWRNYYNRALTGERHTQEIAVFAGRTNLEYEVSFNPIWAGANVVAGVSVFARDITERKKAELALRQSEANLTALIENTDDLIYSLDQGLRLVTANSSFRQALQDLGTDPAATNVAQIGDLAFGHAWEDYYRRALLGQQFRQELPLSLHGEARSIEASFNPILTKEQAVTGVSILARDVTERKRAEDELKRTNFELDSFVYRASHDLRAPLRSVLGLINLIKIEKDDAQKVRFLALVEKSINKLDTFISDLTHFSRNTRMALQRAEIDFKAQIEECLENLRYMEKADRVEARVSLEQQAPFFSDPQRISIVLQNLISNAIKYQRTNVESYVSIQVRTDEHACTLVVADNGKGIEAEYLSRIFEMFFRASEDSYGSGLGLYITAQVIEKLGGKVNVVSHYGEGTRFEVSIPNRPPLPGEEAETAA